MTAVGRKIGARRVTIGCLAVLLVAITGCSSHPKAAAVTVPSSNTPSTANPSTTDPTTPTTSASQSTSTTTGAAATSGPLPGTWSGKYNVASPSTIGGTFTLSWKQTGNKLSGKIAISQSGTSQVTGTLNGNSIRFGSVSQGAIRYTGSVSGGSMSGNFEDPSNSLQGTWSATKSS